MKRKIEIILIILILVFTFASVVYTSSANGDDPYAKIAPESVNGDAMFSMKMAINAVIGVLQLIGITSAIVVLMWLGIKYMSASPSGRAQIKNNMTAYVIGVVLLFSFTGILQLVKKIAVDVTTINTSQSSNN